MTLSRIVLGITIPIDFQLAIKASQIGSYSFDILQGIQDTQGNFCKYTSHNRGEYEMFSCKYN